MCVDNTLEPPIIVSPPRKKTDSFLKAGVGGAKGLDVEKGRRKPKGNNVSFHLRQPDDAHY